MAENNTPKGRQKRVGEGAGKVQKRGSGLSGKTGGPVSGGYSGRTPSSSSGKSEGGSNRAGGTSRNNNASIIPLLLKLFTGKGKSSKPIIIILIVIIGIFLFSKLGGGGDLLGSLGGLLGDGGTTPSLPGFQSAASNSAVTYVDKGAYQADNTVSKLARDKFTTLKGNGKDTATIMIYICGTDLETKYGMATSDINEILHGEISDDVNIIIETGGTSEWKNNVVKNSTNQRYKITNKGMQLIQDNMGKKSMVDHNTLTDFIKYCEKNYPADRYSLIFWDHGGGSVTGYGYDELFKGSSMTIDEISMALKNSKCKFDWIGFDACLMATLETAIALEPYADYMIASEEVEPGIGWHYTGWVTTLSKNPSIATVDLGKKLIDDYVKEVKARVPQSQATLSIIDLAELKGTVPSSLIKFAQSTNNFIEQDDYKTVSDARAGAKEFSPQSKLNQIDLIHFAENMGTKESKALAEALKGCVKYNRTSTNITNSNGVSIYFPYGNTTQLNSAINTYDKIGIDEEYTDCIKSFANVTAGGQITSLGGGNLLDSLLGGLTGGSTTPQSSQGGSNLVGSLLDSFLSEGDFSDITGLAGDALGGWLDIGRMQSSVEYYAENRLDASNLVITNKDGQRVLSLPEDQWDLVQFMEMNVFIDDGEGFIDLGLDNIYEYNDYGDLIMEYDGTWLSLNGQIVGYYVVSEDYDGDNYSITGRVPALLNDQLVDILLVFDNENPYGVVLGAQIKYDHEKETQTLPKGLIDIEKGDKIDYLCDYYTYDGEYTDTYFLGEQYIATGEWTIENISVGDENYQMTYRLTDIYGNRYWTPTVSD